jgi:hypothetical protein|tara:strand:+ start:1334 stop:1507 length:174 start_codon:yes stop_codon:yes gene_type:complete
LQGNIGAFALILSGFLSACDACDHLLVIARAVTGGIAGTKGNGNVMRIFGPPHRDYV